MSSSINPNSINNQYPVAGQDNNSQGFRDNFTAIKNNLDYAKNEISDLQNKALLKAPLAGETTVNNTMSGNVVQSGTIFKDMRESTNNIGSFSTATSIAVVYSTADYQSLTLAGAGAQASQLVFSGFPASGQYAKLTLEVTVSNVDHTLALPAVTINGQDGLSTYNSGTKTFTFDATGIYLFEFGTHNAGATLFIREISRRSAIDSMTISGISTVETLVADNLSFNISTGKLVMSQPVPTTSIGQVGDEIGMFAIDADYIYFCTAAYTGALDIWSRTALTTVGTW